MRGSTKPESELQQARCCILCAEGCADRRCWVAVADRMEHTLFWVSNFQSYFLYELVVTTQHWDW